MPVSRTNHSQNAEASSSKPRNKFTHHKKSRSRDDHEPTAAPGVQKIKAALRQTRRLLAKDKLDAKVRVETERRLKTLEADLHQAEQANKARAMATRYHKVKFFERQKVTRKLKQVQKQIESAEDESQKKTLESTLQELRIDLNYIFHYPQAKKYISLFPPEVRKGETIAAPTPDAEKTAREREEVRKWIREQMDQGNIPAKPELHQSSQRNNSQNKAWLQPGATNTAHQKAQEAEEKDAFFGDDDEEDEEGS
ncbi:hypothetical protein CVT24_008446 [Panaeolus cyanescens]|uniref:rRNA-processing protein EFG1 n=1 Tax=Panaeolus cyanescens TaxID=181874 RepID=A0A409VBY2_9AGAR|nr:hypothetical protein CVT24_008446 [Panaeolus cyanescens]